MKGMLQYLFFGLLGIVLLTGCASQNYGQVVNTWRGASIDDLFHIWGYPSRINKLASGHKILVYADQPACQTLFELDQSNRVIQVTYNGSNCVMTAQMSAARSYQRNLVRATVN